MGAWIETPLRPLDQSLFLSHPTWVRGLKLVKTNTFASIGASHPTWVRGLKHNKGLKMSNDFNVAPYVGAWIETSGMVLTLVYG